MRTQRRGYTLIEILIALSVGLLALFVIMSAIITLANATTQSRQHQRDYTTANELMTAITRSADSATAMFIPPQDVLGNANADGHALGFMAKGHADVPYFWQFVYDANAHTVTEYDYTNFTVPAPIAHGQAFSGVNAFSANRITANQLTDPFLQGYKPTSYELDTGFTGVKMGNTVYAVSLQVGPQQHRNAHLLPSTTVSGFNLVLGNGHGDPLPTPTPGGPTPTPPAGYVSVQVAVWHTKVVAGPGGILYTSGVCSIITLLVPAANAGLYPQPPSCQQGGGGPAGN